MSDFTCGGQVCGTGEWAGPKPGDPDNNVVISAQPAFGGIDVSWTFPGINPHAVAHVILYRSANIEPETMVQLAKVNGTFYFDRSASLTPMEFFYWMRIVSINGTVGPVIGPASSIARDTISDTIKSLTGKIDAGVLSQSLKTDLAKIEINALGITQEILERAQNDDALLQQKRKDVIGAFSPAGGFDHHRDERRRNVEHGCFSSSLGVAGNPRRRRVMVKRRCAFG